MKTQLIKTEDGSHTLYVPELDEHYHSTHGAIQESNHVFIQKGLADIPKKEISVFEVGFGTGLNAILTYAYAKEKDLSIKYHSIEKYPVEAEIFETLNYTDFIDKSLKPTFTTLHEIKWNEEISIDSNFKLKKIESDLSSFKCNEKYEVIYFDAFAPNKQSELWTQEIFTFMASLLKPEGIITTYSVKGDVKRALKAAGLKIEKHPGPPGKREMLRGIKTK